MANPNTSESRGNTEAEDWADGGARPVGAKIISFRVHGEDVQVAAPGLVAI
jgi:hypothetical protein